MIQLKINQINIHLEGVSKARAMELARGLNHDIQNEFSGIQIENRRGGPGEIGNIEMQTINITNATRPAEIRKLISRNTVNAIQSVLNNPSSQT